MLGKSTSEGGCSILSEKPFYKVGYNRYFIPYQLESQIYLFSEIFACFLDTRSELTLIKLNVFKTCSV